MSSILQTNNEPLANALFVQSSHFESIKVYKSGAGKERFTDSELRLQKISKYVYLKKDNQK